MERENHGSKNEEQWINFHDHECHDTEKTRIHESLGFWRKWMQNERSTQQNELMPPQNKRTPTQNERMPPQNERMPPQNKRTPLQNEETSLLRQKTPLQSARTPLARHLKNWTLSGGKLGDIGTTMDQQYQALKRVKKIEVEFFIIATKVRFALF